MSLLSDGLEKIKLFNLGSFVSVLHSEVPRSWCVACWIVALVWLCIRCHSVIRRPKSELVEALGLTEPVIPEVVIDGLGDTWVSICWQYAPPSSSRSRRPKVRKHTIRIGGQVIEAERDARRAVISNLDPDTTYELTVQAVQSDAPVHSQASGAGTSITATASTATLSQPSSFAADLLPIKVSHTGPALPTASSTLGGIGTIYLQTLSSVQDSAPPLSVLLEGNVSDFEDEEFQKVSDVLAVQREVKEAMNQMKSSDLQYVTKYKALVQEFNDLNDRRKQDEACRTQLRIENKNLEDENHALEVQISKIKLQAAKIAKYQAESERSYHKTHEIERQQQQKKSENELLLDTLDSQVKQLQSEEEAKALEMREAAQKLKVEDTRSQRVHALVKKLRDESQFSSAESKLALLSSDDASCLDRAAIQELEHEIQLNNRIELEWARAQKALEGQYVDAYLRNSELKAQQRLGQSQIPSPLSSQLPSQLPSQESVMLDQGSAPQLLRSTPSPPGSVRVGAPSSAPGSLPFLNPSGHSHPSQNPAAGLSKTNLFPMHLASQQPLHSTPSLASFNTVSSLTHPAALPVQPLSGYDPMAVAPPQAAPGYTDQATGPALAPGMPYPYTAVPESTISPTAATHLLPSDLFRETISHYPSHHTANHSSSGDDSEAFGSMNSAELSESERRSLENSRLPWLTSPQRESSNTRRTTSLFFGTHPSNHSAEAAERVHSAEPRERSETALGDTKHADTAEAIVIDDAADSEPETSTGADTNTMSRSPLRNMGSRFFQKSQNKSGGFVRRLSIFSRRDSEQKLEEEADA